MTEQKLTALVHFFYTKVRGDALLGPVFDDAIADWDAHLGKMSAFWSSVMLTTGAYKGQPVAAHLKHKAAIEPVMFDRWLELWRECAAQVLDEPGAAAVIAKAERIAESLQLAMFFKIEKRPEAAA